MEDFVAQRSSQEHKDAADLWELFNTTKNRILDAQDKADEVESEPRRGRPPKVSSYSTCDVTLPLVSTLRPNVSSGLCAHKTVNIGRNQKKKV